MVNNTFGSVTGGFICIQARMCPTTVTKLRPSNKIRASYNTWAILLAGSISSLKSVSPTFDYEEDFFDRKIYCIEIAVGGLKLMSQPMKGAPFISTGLLLEPTGKKGEYRRLGDYQLNHQYNLEGWRWASVKRKVCRLLESKSLDRAYKTAGLDERLCEKFDGLSKYKISII